MHSKGMMHRDIKSDNIFIFAKKHYKLGFLPLYSSFIIPGILFIGDLGLSKDLSTLAPAAQSKAGTPFVFIALFVKISFV